MPQILTCSNQRDEGSIFQPLRVRWMWPKYQAQVIDLVRMLRTQNTPNEHEIQKVILTHLDLKGGIGVVALMNDRVVGYMLYQMKAPYVLLRDVGVVPHYQHRGIGTRVITKLKERLSAQGQYQYLVTTVPESNLPLLHFLVNPNRGFRAQGIVQDFYPSHHDAAIVMVHTHPGATLPFTASLVTKP